MLIAGSVVAVGVLAGWLAWVAALRWPAAAITPALGRPRPALGPLVGFSGASFPSGHATAAAATLLATAMVLGRGRSRGLAAALSGAAIGLAVMVAASRVVLGVHWFTDVLAGLLLGWGWVAVCWIAFGRRILHGGEPVAVQFATDLDGDTVASSSGTR